jgi:hypothetical protein
MSTPIGLCRGTPGTPIGLAVTCWAQWLRRFAAPPFLIGARRAGHPGADPPPASFILAQFGKIRP